MKGRYDAVVIGAGHNGLVAAGYLAKNGLSVLVAERREVVGGAVWTHEIVPGFRVSAGAQVLGMLRARIIEDLELRRHGLAYTLRDPDVFTPYADGSHIFWYPDSRRTAESIARLAPEDGAAYPAFGAMLERGAAKLEPFLMRPRPSMAEFADAFADEPELLNTMLFASVRDVVDRYFRSDKVTGPLCYFALSGTGAGPSTPGTAFLKFFVTATDLGGARGNWALVHGGMGAITQALAASVRALGGEIETGVEVAGIAMRAGRAAGVVLADGREIAADIVLSNADAKRTFCELAPVDAVAPEIRSALAARRVEGTGFKINFAVGELPDFHALPGKIAGPQHRAGIILAPPPDMIERGWDEAKVGRPTARPFTHFIIQSATDPTLAPEGKHTISMWGHHFPYRLAAGLDFATERARLAERMIDLVGEFAPNFRASIIAPELYTPRDIETAYGLAGGQIYQGDMLPGGILWDRPLPGASGLGDVVRGLYLCGAAAHPGGLVSGMPGHNAARAVLADMAAGQFKQR